MSAIAWDGPRRQECPECGRSPKDKTLGVTIDDRGTVAHCFRCEFTAAENDEECRRTLRPHSRIPVCKAPSKHESLSDYGGELWRACRPISGPARAYLDARGCVIPPADGDLRWHPVLKHSPSHTSGPALVALVTDAATREPLTLHRTWIRADGTKADVDPPRMLLGGHRKAGGVVRLWPDEAVTYGLGIAEGIETALSLAHGFSPAWACIDAGNLAAFPVLPGIESLVIAADHDAAGIRAANECSARLRDAGRDAGIVMSPTPKEDLNDVSRVAT